MLALFLARLARLEQTRKRAFPRLLQRGNARFRVCAARKRAFICRLDIRVGLLEDLSSSS